MKEVFFFFKKKKLNLLNLGMELLTGAGKVLQENILFKLMLSSVAK